MYSRSLDIPHTVLLIYTDGITDVEILILIFLFIRMCVCAFQIFDFQLTTDDMETVSGLNKNHRLLGRYFLNDDG